MKVSELPLNELYERTKITASVEAAILQKEDFSSISPTYCEKVCRLNCKNPSVVKLLNTKVDILIIQDHYAPKGKFDRREGQSEQTQRNLIEFIAKKAGFEGLTYRVVTLLKCLPTEEDFPRGKPPTATKLLKCKPYLYQEIINSKPSVIISLSTVVTKALGLKKHSNSGNRGEIVEIPAAHVVLTIHPKTLTMIRQNASGVFWGADYMEVIVRDFVKAANIARKTLTVPSLSSAITFYKNNRIRIARSLEDIKSYLAEIDSLDPRSIISFDTETTGLDGMREGAKLLCIQFGWKHPTTGNVVSVVIPLYHRDNTNYNPDDAWRLIVPLLVGPRGKVAHNGKFDILYIYHTTGVRLKNLVFDTMLILHSLDSGTQGCYSLKTAVTDYLPYTGLSGYENLLPKLTKSKPSVVEGVDGDGVSEENQEELDLKEEDND